MLKYPHHTRDILGVCIFEAKSNAGWIKVPTLWIKAIYSIYKRIIQTVGIHHTSNYEEFN